ncbi:MAG: hypothetical protein JO001_21190 [Alphaproteobacteria bacterium]|nr:hypothetical protein [Alphaproteobacteria bacterium]
MTRFRFSLLLILLIPLVACNGPRPFVREGDPDSLQITYAGDVEATHPIARGYCERYERRAVFLRADGEIAVYNCVAR